MMDMPDKQVRVVVMGNSRVGKSSLIRRYITPSHKPVDNNAEVDFVTHIVKYDGKTVQLQIWDSAGLETNEYHTVTPSYFRGADVIVLLYDVSVKASFDDLASWITRVGQVASPDSQKIVVGNKCDLTLERVISSEEAEQFSNSRLQAAYMETSATKNINVTDLFNEVMKTALSSTSREVNPSQTPPPPSGGGIKCTLL
uniref:Uncharacterized protein n=1 Tax=Vannella robusta TaxID=1487602 RepID=A0A7S4IGR0_9EUKA|mmetsp:Transcript_25617/g.32643  ORF Transcript_25617/g.32643 Transcript_25617/m.32643 type:complete len:199 (+) Transcript_25617:3-599(+)